MKHMLCTVFAVQMINVSATLHLCVRVNGLLYLLLCVCFQWTASSSHWHRWSRCTREKMANQVAVKTVMVGTAASPTFWCVFVF